MRLIGHTVVRFSCIALQTLLLASGQDPVRQE
jgi:hypothetical protein